MTASRLRRRITTTAAAALVATAAFGATGPARAEAQATYTCEGPLLASPVESAGVSCTHDLVPGVRRFKVLWTPGTGAFSLTLRRGDGFVLARHTCAFEGLEAECSVTGDLAGATVVYGLPEAALVRGQFHTYAGLEEAATVEFEAGLDESVTAGAGAVRFEGN